MSKIGELLDQLTANKRATDELEAAIAATGEVVDQIAAQLSNLGAAGKAEQVQQVQTQLADARNTRWLSEGHLEDAIMVLQSAIDGQKGIGTSLKNLPTTTPTTPTTPEEPKTQQDPVAAPPNSTTYTTDVDGQPVDITLVSPEPEHEPEPAGEELVEQSQEDEGLSRARTAARATVRKIDDVQDQVKEWATPIDNLGNYAPASGEVEASTVQDTEQHTYVQAVDHGPPAVSVIDAAVYGFAIGIGALEASLRARQRDRRDE